MKRHCLISAGLFACMLASAWAAEPEIVVMTHQASGYFALRNVAFKVFYNKFESKFMPVGHYDLLANARFDLMNALADDKRARWREATPEDGLDFVDLWNAKKPVMPDSLKGDAVLMVCFLEFGSGFKGAALVRGEVRLLNRQGKRLWKEEIEQRDKDRKEIEEWIREDPATVRTLLNTLQEQAVAEAVKKIAKQKVTP